MESVWIGLEEILMKSSEESHLLPSGERAVRIFVLAMAALVCIGSVPGLIGIVRASDGTLNPPHSDFGLDTTIPPNGLYDELIVDVSIDVTVAGAFYVLVDLYDNTGSWWIDGVFTNQNLPLGVQSIQISFPGYIIRQSGYDGPYEVDIILLDDMMNFLDTGIHMTNAYLHTEFENPPAVFSPPHSEFVLDNNGNSLHDHLVVSANLTVNVSGDYNLEAGLYDSTGMFFIEFQTNSTTLGVGVQNVDLAFTGYVIRSSGFDGPYRAELYLYDQMWNSLDNDTYFTNPYLATEFEFPPALFSPPHSDYGLDTNGNFLHDFLVVSTSVNVTVEGTYIVEGFSVFGFTENETYLTTGIQTVDLRFYGYEIFNSGVDGPYMINLDLRDEFFVLLDSDIHNTGPYLFTDFDPNPPVTFSPPHWDYGLDTDGDSDFNYLIINANVTVNASGTYEISVDLYDITGMTWITSESNMTWLNIGTNTVDVPLLGGDINVSGFDGPYFAYLYAYDEIGWILDSDTYITNAYLFTDFDQHPGSFSPPHSDYGLDTSIPADGIYEFLVVNASVVVNEPGWFMVQSVLFDPMFNPVSMVQQTANLSAGFHNISLKFSGVDINRRGLDGLFFAQLNLLVFELGGPPYSIDTDFHMTSWYDHTDFVSLPVSVIWGYVYDASDGSPVSSADVILVNYSYGWMVQRLADFSGYYDVDAFDGDFVVVLDDEDLQASLSLVSVTGDTEVTRSLEQPVPDSVDTVVTFFDWDNAGANTSVTMGDDNESFRFMIDMMVGNWDGYVDQNESDIFMSMALGGSSGMMPTDTIDMLYVDGIHYDFVPGSDTLSANLVGPVAPPSPLTLSMRADFTSNTTIPVAGIHRVEVNNTYDNDDEVSSLSGQFPAGFNLWGYDPVVNVSVSGIGTPNFLVDPLRDPDPLDSIDYAWVNLTVGLGAPDTTEPQVHSATINGQASQTYGLSNLPAVIYINATIDDSTTGDTQIGGANFTEGPQNWASSVLMSPLDGSYNSSVEDVTGTIVVPPLGMSLYCVYGWDLVPNHNTAGSCAMLNILDDLEPQISNVLIDGAPMATYFLSSAPQTGVLTATVDDTATGGADIAGANYTTPLIDSWPGISMNATDGTFDDSIEDVTVNVTIPTTAGTFDYYVHAWDTSMNYYDSPTPAQAIIVDDVEPMVTDVLLNGQPGASVMPGTPVVVEALVDDTSGRGDSLIGGANYTIEGDWLTSTPLQAADGGYDESTERVNSTLTPIDTTGWPDADYTVCVYAWDVLPNNNVSGSCALLTISSVDTEPPIVLSVLLNNQLTLTVSPGTIVFLNATIDDAPAFGSNVSGANYSIDRVWDDANVMFPTDGAFDSQTEDVNVTIYTSGWPDADYEICVHGWDDVPNNNESFLACRWLTVQTPVIPDTEPPTITNVLADPDPQAPDEDVRISATVDDNEQVFGAWVEIRDPDGTAVGNYSMAYDSVNDEYYYTDSYGDEGTYTFTIWANDTSDNWAASSDDFDIVEQTPPTIEVTVSDETPEVGDTVTFEADVQDESAIDDVRITIRDSEDNIVVNNRPMTEDGGVYVYEVEFDEPGEYTYTIRAEDEHGNSDEETDTITVSEAAGPSFLEEYWWLLLLIIVIIVVVVAAVAVLLRRKPKVVEAPVAPVEEIPPSEPEAPPVEPEEAPIVEEVPEEPPEPPSEELSEPPPPGDLE